MKTYNLFKMDALSRSNLKPYAYIVNDWLSQRVYQYFSLHDPCPLTYRSTWPAERSRMWEEIGRGKPFLSQFSCGRGEPVTTHCILTELSRTAVRRSMASLLPSITGGTVWANGECVQKREKSLHIIRMSFCLKKKKKEQHAPYTFRLNILSSSPAALVATQVYFPLSAGRARVTVSVLPSGLTLSIKTPNILHQKHMPRKLSAGTFWMYSKAG